MVDRAIALEALGATCNANISPLHAAAGSVLGPVALGGAALLGTAAVAAATGGVGLLLLAGAPEVAGIGAALFGVAAANEVAGVVLGAKSGGQLGITNFIPTVLDGEQTCSVSQYNSARIQDVLLGSVAAVNPLMLMFDSAATSRSFVINEKEFFDPDFDYDFRGRTDTKTYYRGGEEYTRPSGWYRFALKVLDKYDDNTWLGNRDRTTESVAGEWPVSYHGTSVVGAKGIIKGNYKAGPRDKYGNGVYSTPDISEAEGYAKWFTSKVNGKTYKVVLQNRINPKYREKHNNDLYWLVRIPAGATSDSERLIVQQAIRPYGLLLKEV